MNNRERLLLLAGASIGAMSIGVVSHAQVSMPKTGTLNSAQPVFCVNPTTAAIEDCVSSANVTVGNVTVTNLANGNLTSAGNVTTIAGSVANTTLQTQTDTVMVGGVNVKEINAVTPLMGAGASGTGSQRVTAAQDTTTIAGSARGLPAQHPPMW